MAKPRVWVEHGMYGCATGCCGHFVRIEGGHDVFEFAHPWGKDDPMTWAREFADGILAERRITEYTFDESACQIGEC